MSDSAARLILNPDDAVIADIFSHEDGVSWVGPTWPSDDGTAIILCPDCGEHDVAGRYFAANTIYSNWGEIGAPEKQRCRVCKNLGFMRVGI